MEKAPAQEQDRQLTFLAIPAVCLYTDRQTLTSETLLDQNTIIFFTMFYYVPSLHIFNQKFSPAARLLFKEKIVEIEGNVDLEFTIYACLS